MAKKRILTVADTTHLSDLCDDVYTYSTLVWLVQLAQILGMWEFEIQYEWAKNGVWFDDIDNGVGPLLMGRDKRFSCFRELEDKGYITRNTVHAGRQHGMRVNITVNVDKIMADMNKSIMSIGKIHEKTREIAQVGYVNS